MIVLSYLWILALIPLLVEKDDAEVQWHAKHGLVLTGVELLFWVGLTVTNAFSGCLGCMLLPVAVLAWAIALVVRVFCIAKGVNGQRFIVPGISQYADRL